MKTSPINKPFIIMKKIRIYFISLLSLMTSCSYSASDVKNDEDATLSSGTYIVCRTGNEYHRGSSYKILLLNNKAGAHTYIGVPSLGTTFYNASKINEVDKVYFATIGDTIIISSNGTIEKVIFK